MFHGLVIGVSCRSVHDRYISYGFIVVGIRHDIATFAGVFVDHEVPTGSTRVSMSVQFKLCFNSFNDIVSANISSLLVE